jgi:rhodanese-related sulfurtransferase
MSKFYCTLLFVLFTTSCTSQNPKDIVNFKDVNKAIGESKIVLFDVRTKSEVNEGAIPSAIWSDYYNPAFKSTVAKLDTSKTYYIYCKAGVRSKLTMNMMRKMGFSKVYNYKGGFDDWIMNKGKISRLGK